MFEAIELGHSLSKEQYQAAVPPLRVDLVNAQFELRSRDFPLLIVLSGDDRVAVNDLTNLLHEWMDARYIETVAPGAETQEELEQPALFRYWRSLPPRGRTAVYAGDWTFEAVRARVTGDLKKRGFERALERIASFEKMLVDDGALLIKFWLHLPERQHAKRAAKGSRDWKISRDDRLLSADYARFRPCCEAALLRTGTTEAPWNIIESTDRRFRSVEVCRRILASLKERLADQAPSFAGRARADAPSVAVDDRTGDPRTVLDRVDLSQTLSEADYEARLPELQERLHELSSRATRRGVPSVLVFEGWDAAGKGGCIRRLTATMDARYYRVVPIAAPTPEEKAHHYLWRFWRRLPRPGHFTIFDRSWYGRVLVERVEGFAREDEWKRAYVEINEFEQELVEHGVVLVKFWLHVDQEEQLARFQQREQTDYKNHKITAEDYRNRESWYEYERAVSDMVARTSTPACPWQLVAARDKRHARVEVFTHTIAALEQKLGPSGKGRDKRLSTRPR